MHKKGWIVLGLGGLLVLIGVAAKFSSQNALAGNSAESESASAEFDRQPAISDGVSQRGVGDGRQ